MKRFFINITAVSFLLWGGVSIALALDNIPTTPVYLQSDGSYTDKDNNKIDPSLVLKKYETVSVKKYLDLDKNIYVDEKDKVEGGNYKEVTVTEKKLNYYILNKMEYTQAGLTEGTSTSKLDYSSASYNYKKEYGHKTASASQEVKHFKWNKENGGLKLGAGTKENHDLAYYVVSNRKISDKVSNMKVSFDPPPVLDLNKDHIGASDSSDLQLLGGAMYNNQALGPITGDFINNSAIVPTQSGSQLSASGGAIYNSNLEIEKIKGNFISNSVLTTNGASYGGAIDNHGLISNIEGDFIGNYTQSGEDGFDMTATDNGARSAGGAIYSTPYGKYPTGIGNIKGNFIGNHAYSQKGYAEGGAIAHRVEINNIEGDFIGNWAESVTNMAQGGAIFQKDSTVSQKSRINGDIKGNFIENSVISQDKSAIGGAIYTKSRIEGNIEGDFIGNRAKSVANMAQGGAIYQSNDTSFKDNPDIERYIKGNIIGKYIGNSAISEENYAYGGAIYNQGLLLGNMEVDFINNSVEGTYALGGAIYNVGTIGNNADNYITGNFVSNNAIAKKAENVFYSRGGAIFNSGAGKISSITETNFIDNSASSDDTYGQGGAIYNAGTISEIKNSNFYDNHADGKAGYGSSTLGGAIYSTTSLNITADDNKTSEFSGNYIKNGDIKTDNAIYMGTANTTLTLKANENGKIIFKDSITGSANGYNINILSNDGTGSVLLHNNIQNANLITDNVLVDFADGKIRDHSLLSLTTKNDSRFKIDLSFEGNEGEGASDRFIISNADKSSGTIKLDKINFIDTVEDGKTYTIEIIEADNNNVKLELGADILTKDNVSNTIYSDTIVAEPDSINIVSTNGKTDNAIVITGKVYNSLDLLNSSNDPERNFLFKENDSYIISSDLSTTGAGILNIKGQKGGLSLINGNGKTLFNLENETTLNLNNVKITGAKSVAEGTNDKATINVVDSEISDNAQGIKTAANVNIYGATTVKNNGGGIDTTSAITLDAQGKTMNIDDNLKGSEISIKNGSVNLYKNVTTPETAIENANVALKNDAVLNGTNLTINKGANDSISSLNFVNGATGAINYNKLTLNSDVNMKVDVDLAKETMDTISANDFINVDGYKINVSDIILLSDALKDETNIQFADENLKNSVTTSVKEVAYSPVYKYDVKYDKDNGEFNFTRGDASGSNGHENLNPSVLAAPVAANVSGYLNQLQSYNEAFYSMDSYMLLSKAQRLALRAKNKYAISENTPLLYEKDYSSGWFRPYTTIEKVNLKRGPKVDNVAYGSFFGNDGVIRELGKGWEHQWGMYAGYTGSHQKYDGISLFQNGGMLGFTSNLYKGNFFQGLTVNVGGSGIHANTFNGNDNFGMFTSGVATKFGFNSEFADGRFILQPSYLMSYSLIKTMDYTDSMGVRVDSDPLHAVHIEPGLKLILNSKSGWQSYLGASMIFNILNGSDYKISDIALMDMSIKPFVRYGLGVKKTMGDDFAGFLQAYATNGGRNGIGFQGGLNWAVGKKKKARL